MDPQRGCKRNFIFLSLLGTPARSGGADSRKNFQPASARFSGFPPAFLMGLNVESTAPIPDLPVFGKMGVF